jgi:hypothetical protein
MRWCSTGNLRRRDHGAPSLLPAVEVVVDRLRAPESRGLCDLAQHDSAPERAPIKQA